MSLGTDRVRLDFNPSKASDVDSVKQRTAELIDWCNARLDSSENAEVKRLWALAMTHYEDAAMWAVKATTAK